MDGHLWASQLTKRFLKATQTLSSLGIYVAFMLPYFGEVLARTLQTDRNPHPSGI